MVEPGSSAGGPSHHLSTGKVITILGALGGVVAVLTYVGISPPWTAERTPAQQIAACRERHNLPADTTLEDVVAPVTLRRCTWPAPKGSSDGYYEIRFELVVVPESSLMEPESRAYILTSECASLEVTIGYFKFPSSPDKWTSRNGQLVGLNGEPTSVIGPLQEILQDPGPGRLEIVAGGAYDLVDVSCID